MRKLEVAVCDICDGYRDRFVTYLVEHKSREMAVQAFSTLELFLETITQRKFDVAILGRGFETAEEAAKEQNLPYILLKDTMPECVAEESGYETGETMEVAEIFRYQPMEAILHEVQILSAPRLVSPAAMKYLSGGLEVIGVCSSVRHEMQMPFSLVFSSMVSEKKKVLYVNLMEHSGFGELLGLSGQHDLGDVIIKLRSHRLMPETFLRSVYEVEGIHYIPPFSNPENLHELTLQDYLLFLEFLEEKTDFEVVLFDFGEGLTQFVQMLERCSSIYCLVKPGYFFDCQTRQFMDYLQRMSDDRLLERINVAEVPFSARRIRGGNDVLRQLLWSEFGDYVREYLMGAGYESQ